MCFFCYLERVFCVYYVFLSLFECVFSILVASVGSGGGGGSAVVHSICGCFCSGGFLLLYLPVKSCVSIFWHSLYFLLQCYTSFVIFFSTHKLLVSMRRIVDSDKYHQSSV